MSDHVLVIAADADWPEWCAEQDRLFPLPNLAVGEVFDATVEFLQEHHIRDPAGLTVSKGVPFTEAQAATVQEAVTAARTHGHLRTPRILVRFHDRLPDGAGGITRRREGEICIDLGVWLDRAGLRRIALHELQHAADKGRRLLLPLAELERRAESFAVIVANVAAWDAPEE